MRKSKSEMRIKELLEIYKAEVKKDFVVKTGNVSWKELWQAKYGKESLQKVIKRLKDNTSVGDE